MCSRSTNNLMSFFLLDGNENEQKIHLAAMHSIATNCTVVLRITEIFIRNSISSEFTGVFWKKKNLLRYFNA